jgi:hypothetical protein
MTLIKFHIDKLIPELIHLNDRLRWSAPLFNRKLPKDMIFSDYDIDEKLVEFELADGSRSWFPLKSFFGTLITESNSIQMIHKDGMLEPMSIAGVGVVRIKRTNYLKLIFENDLPF